MTEWSDISDGFVFVEDKLIYVDQPLEGFLRSRETGEVFAFRVIGIIQNMLWHWILLPVHSSDVDVNDVFAMAAANPPTRWMSIVEDRRGEKPRLFGQWIERSGF